MSVDDDDDDDVFPAVTASKQTVNTTDNVTASQRDFPIFTARAYARAVLGVVILSVRPSVCLSVCHTRAL